MESGPFAEVGGVGADVDCYVPYVAGEDADQLSLRLLELIVESAEDTLGGKGLGVLNEIRGQTLLGEGFIVENFCKPTATIPEATGLNEFYITKRGIKDGHSISLVEFATIPFGEEFDI